LLGSYSKFPDNFFLAFYGSGLAFDKSVNSLSFRFGASKYEEVIVNIKENQGLNLKFFLQVYSAR